MLDIWCKREGECSAEIKKDFMLTYIHLLMHMTYALIDETTGLFPSCHTQ